MSNMAFSWRFAIFLSCLIVTLFCGFKLSVFTTSPQADQEKLFYTTAESRVNYFPNGTGDDSDPDLAFPFFLDRVDTEAKCLDGTPALYYHRSGWGSGASSWLLFYEGNGFCDDLQSCAGRTEEWGGSSRAESEKSRYNITNQNFMFSRDPKLSPLLHNWHHVFFRYCDGGYFSGERAGTVSVSSSSTLSKKTNLYIRGRAITDAGLSDLVRSRGMKDAERVVITGCSSGAVHAIAHGDYMVEKIKLEMQKWGGQDGKVQKASEAESDSRPTDFAIFPDVGIYLDTDLFREPKKFVVSPEGHNATSLFNERCLTAQPAERAGENCLIGSIGAAYVSTPWFASQSRFDKDQLEVSITEQCYADAACVNKYGAELTKAMHKLVFEQPQPTRGAFLDSCFRHCGKVCTSGPETQAVGEYTGKNALQLFADWWVLNFGTISSAGLGTEDAEKVIYDSQESRDWPCKDCCTRRPGVSTAAPELQYPPPEDYRTVLS
eukprot:Cvel_25225.t1-p1 / transcript=Cvel_25225.t1 / gene=Cvel_25225 / organism=Chromera_velia_CCMP2878 / gene_product=hypothetical protein / transcript_product=hypothetical protein / location=Cvel_scaffold2828:17113-18582(-) / protein_length=490 / sequence_SO=supercontig / SO=protein_coding / is_pseudo=false